MRAATRDKLSLDITVVEFYCLIMGQHQNLATLAAALFFSLLTLPILADIPSCTSNRPGWADHRTLYLPSRMLGKDRDEEQRQANALCCIYTHVVENKNANNPYMETYDGSTYSIGNLVSAVDVMKLQFSSFQQR